ncbi:Transposase, Mutator family [Nitrosomonas aestuarii]|uniref:Mutator family transposase n=1 Tax=Nitrosomonas aestuarii TaxID=52441 RepID=A0A1I4CBD7_9PROT|nr:Transposase, Mutator family [Nitrosomonas aestuarii]
MVFFKYPEQIRRVMYTTNTIEAIHRQFHKLTKTKVRFSKQNNLLKLLYVGIKNASTKWTMPFPNWNLAVSQLAICFEELLDATLDL